MPEITFNTCTGKNSLYFFFFSFVKKNFFRIITPKFKLETEPSQSDGSGCSQIPRPRNPDGCGWVEVATWAMRKGTEPGVWRRAALAAGHSATQTHSSCSSPNLVSSHTKKITQYRYLASGDREHTKFIHFQLGQESDTSQLILMI